MLRWLSFLLLFYTSVLFAYDPYSNSELDTLKKQFIEEINRSPQVVREPLTVHYLNELGQRLTQSIHMHPAQFFIVNSSELNAFAGPGGYIGIHTTLILATQNEDELAAVMAHELAHVKLHHLYDMIENQKLMRIPTAASLLAALALGVINPTLGTGALAATLSGAAQHSINFTRAHEREADRIGMQMLIKAGFNPKAMALFFRKLKQETRYYDADNIPALLRTHPLDEERIAEVEDRLPKNTPLTYSSSLRYALFKALIRNIMVHEPKTLIDYYTRKPHLEAPQNQYGLALAFIEANRFQDAFEHLRPLITASPHEPFYVHAFAQIQLGKHESKEAAQTLAQLHQDLPDSYATTLAFAQTLMQSAQTKQAVVLLTKAFRKAPKDLTLCKLLAKAESQDHHPAYAYFIEAQCDHLEGHDKLAIQRLKTAQKLVKHDPYLHARIDAKLEEIQFLTTNH